MIAQPRKAATVILLKKTSPGGFEVYLLKRHEKSNFMAGNYVYPGGRLDREDFNPEICSTCRGMTPEAMQEILGGGLSPEESLAYWIAGIRELFEEAGVLLAYGSQGDPLSLNDPEDRKRFSYYRDQLQKEEITLCEITRKEKIFLALDRVRYYAHWVTPEARPQRFDTVFFIALHSEGQEPAHDQKETTAGLWTSPKDALQKNLAGKILLSPPTLKTLEDLSRFQTIEEMIRPLEKPSIRPVLPVLTQVSDEPVIVFPWDPEFEMFKRGESPEKEGHGRISKESDHTTRVVFRGGRWLPYCHE